MFSQKPDDVLEPKPYRSEYRDRINWLFSEKPHDVETLFAPKPDSSKLGWLFEGESDDKFPTESDHFSSAKSDDAFVPKINSSKFAGLFSEEPGDAFAAEPKPFSSAKQPYLGALFSDEPLEPFVDDPGE